MRLRLIVVSGVLALAAAIIVLATTSGSGHRRSRAAASPAVTAPPAGRASAGVVDVTIPSQPTLRSVPRSFLGLSTEYWSVPLWANHLPLLDGVLSLLRVDGPLTLRIGRDSADQSFLLTRHELPEWTYELTSSWLTQAAAIVRSAGVRLILDLNLATATAQIAGQWAQRAEATLHRGSILGFEVGNEPDIYLRSYWRKKLNGYTGLPELPVKLTARDYAKSFVHYSRVLGGVAPGVPLLAPALAEPQKNLSWVSRLLAGRIRGYGQ